jgi:hypothetical protein
MPMLKIIKTCYQVSIAMEYLSSKNLVHRDLAARNVLIVSENLAKVIFKLHNQYINIDKALN